MSDPYLLIAEIQKHVSLINGELTSLKIDIAVLQTQMENLIFWFRLLVGGFVAFVISQVWQMFCLRKLNNRKKK